MLKRPKPEEIFKKNSSEKLGKRTAQNGIYSVVTQVLKFVLGLISTVVLARLLTPDDFGLIAMVAAITSLVNLLKDAGLSMATIQQENITQDQISSLFWVNVLVSTGLAFILVLSAPLIVNFYERDELFLITILISFSILISGFSVQHKALLKRVIRFDLIGIVEVGARAIGLIAAISFALWNWNHLALVFQILFTSIATVIITYFLIPWKPDLSLKGKGVKDMLFFGGNVTGFNFINYLERNTDDILIGKYIGGDALGEYSKAYSIFMMPITQIRAPLNSLTIPILSKLRDEPKRYVRYCKMIVEVLAILSLPLSLIFFLEAEFLINIFLGSGWEGAIPIFQILAPIAPLKVILGIRGGVLLSMGFSKRYFRQGLVYSVLTIIGFVIGLSYGVKGIALAFLIVQYVLAIPSLFYSFYKTPFKVSTFFKTILPQLPIFLIALSVYTIIDYSFINNIWTTLMRITSIVLLFIILNGLRSEVRASIKMIWNQLKAR